MAGLGVRGTTRRAPSGSASRPVGRLVAAGVLVTLLFVAALQVAVAGALRDRVPQIALRFSPADAIARSALAGAYGDANIAEYETAADGLARSALRRTPIAPTALRVLGEREGVPAAQAGRIMEAAQRLTKRDPQMLLWLAQRELAANNIDGAIGLFDTALRSSVSGRDLLFPALAAAAAEPRVGDALAARLRQDPTWRDSFTGYLVDENPDKLVSARVLGAYLDRKDRNDSNNARSLVLRLAQAGQYRRAWDVKRDFGLGHAPARGGVIDGGFESISDVLPFAWTFADQPDRWAEIVPAPEGDGKVLAVNANSGADGVAASQAVRVAPGSYRISARSGGFGTDAAAAPILAVNCVTVQTPTPVARLSALSATGGARTLSGRFTVPANCPFQTVSIIVVNTEGNEPWVDDITITRD